ncbi:MAG: histidine ammonia-lyase [Actinobacteria bacterium]|nr:histidine ammonia-lyase [Actinomycetota bacterium]
MTVVLTGATLTLEEVLDVARGDVGVELEAAALERMERARAVAEGALAAGELVYGLSTGVGVRKRAQVGAAQQGDFNTRLILNHLVGQGEQAPDEVVRATLLVLANGFARGAGLAGPRLAQRVVAALNERRQLRIRVLGSVGQADLAQLADLARDLLGDEGRLEAGEGLALLSSNAFATGFAALAVADLERLLQAALVAGALDLEAFAANLSSINPAIARERPYPGLAATLKELGELLAGSELFEPGAARNLQDPLTFRCLPQVHGAALDALAFARTQLEVELNAAQGNPLVDVEGGQILSVGNFDSLPLATALDLLRIALAPLLTSANERMVKLLQAPLSGLPEGLSPRAGSSEDSLSEYGPAGQALTAEARLLAQPVSYELASSAHAEGIEDRMTMAPLAARRLAEMVSLGERIVTIELLVACQAIDLRQHRLGEGTRRAHALVRECVEFKNEEHPIPPTLEPLRELVRSGTLEPTILSAPPDSPATVSTAPTPATAR